jgi:predicted ATPase
MARLDRLTTVKAVAQLGATIGRTFTYELLQAVASLDHATLQQGMRQLVEVELVYQHGVPPQATYTFKHALIQDAAYQSLLKSTRQQYHQRIAQVLEAQFPETAETQPELLAHHYTEAGLSEQAVGYWQKAGQRAGEHSAYVEAISHLAQGLKVLTTLLDTPERTKQELDLQIILGPALIATKGYAAPEVEKTYARARELCQQMGDTLRLFPVLRGLWLLYYVRAELRTAQELGGQLLTLAQRVQDPAFLVEACRAVGTTLFWLGELDQARAHLEQGIAFYDSQQHHDLAFVYGQDPRVTCLGFLAWALWALGYPNQALDKSLEALTLAEELAHPFSLAFALDWTTEIHLLRREWQLAQERAEALIALSREQGFEQRLAEGTAQRGWALAEQGQSEEGVAQIHHGLAALRTTWAEIARPQNLTRLAAAYGKRGQSDEGLHMLAEALALADNGDVRWRVAEIYQLKGDLILRQTVPVERDAENCFHQALEVARCQQAKSWELRAALSLSRLWQQQGRRQQANDLLAPIYGWFTEGFDTADLQEAKALLETLA